MRKLKLEELGRASIAAYQAIEKVPIVVILDNVRSAMNVGSVFRTSDGFSVERIILTGICSQPPHKEINKTAIGADRSVAWQYFKEVKEAIKELKSDGYYIIGVEQTDTAILLQDFEIVDQPIALVFGNEVDGISDEILDDLDIAIEIPQYGTKHSFNVAVSAGIVLWEVFKKIKF